MADDATYLAELESRRQTLAGIKATQIADQATTFDLEALDREIARVKRVLGSCGTAYPNMRVAAFNKGV